MLRFPTTDTTSERNTRMTSTTATRTTTETYAVLAVDHFGITVDGRGDDGEALADRFAAAAQQELDKWPNMGLIYMLVTGGAAEDAVVTEARRDQRIQGRRDVLNIVYAFVDRHAETHDGMVLGNLNDLVDELAVFGVRKGN
jgi:hypothetical protein